MKPIERLLQLPMAYRTWLLLLFVTGGVLLYAIQLNPRLWAVMLISVTMTWSFWLFPQLFELKRIKDWVYLFSNPGLYMCYLTSYITGWLVYNLIFIW